MFGSGGGAWGGGVALRIERRAWTAFSCSLLTCEGIQGIFNQRSTSSHSKVQRRTLITNEQTFCFVAQGWLSGSSISSNATLWLALK